MAKLFDLELSVEDIARAFLQASNGDGRLLNTTLETAQVEDGVWGKALKFLTPESNTFSERRYLCNYWLQNRKNVKEKFQTLKGKKASQSSQNINQKTVKEVHKKGCLCESYYKERPNDRRILCDIFLQKHHVECEEISGTDFASSQYSCRKCRGAIKLYPALDKTLTQTSEDVDKEDRRRKEEEDMEDMEEVGREDEDGNLDIDPLQHCYDVDGKEGKSGNSENESEEDDSEDASDPDNSGNSDEGADIVDDWESDSDDSVFAFDQNDKDESKET